MRLRLAADDRLVASVRRGDSAAFEVLYERHSRGLLSFCVYMLGSRHDAEDALQATFVSAYRSLCASERPVALRPWLFTIARNDCLSILRARRPTVELNGEPALRGDPAREAEVSEEVRHTLESMRKLPEEQRAALVLAELHGLSQAEIGTVLGVEAKQVKAYIYQARSNLLSERRARETDCREIREELATARGAALLRGRLRRHLRACPDCRVYASAVGRQRSHLAALLPLAPTLLLRYRAIEEALGIGSADPATYAGGATAAGVAGTAAEIATGGVKALAVKVATSAALLGVTAGFGASILAAQEERPPTLSSARGAASLRAASEPARTTSATRSVAALGRPASGGGPVGVGHLDGEAPSTGGRPRGITDAGGGGGGDSGSQPDGGTGGEAVSGAEQAATSSPAPTAGGPVRSKQSGEGRQRREERRTKDEEERQQRSEEHLQREEAKQQREEAKTKREEEDKRRREAHEQEHEERERAAAAGGHRKGKEELQRLREERVKHRKERAEQRSVERAGGG